MLFRPSPSDKRFTGVSGLWVSADNWWLDSWNATQSRNVLVITCCSRFTSLTRSMTGLIVGSPEEGFCQTLWDQMEFSCSPAKSRLDTYDLSIFFALYCTCCCTSLCQKLSASTCPSYTLYALYFFTTKISHLGLECMLDYFCHNRSLWILLPSYQL